MVVLTKYEKFAAAFLFLLNDLAESSPKTVGSRLVGYGTHKIDVKQILSVELLRDRGSSFRPLWKVGDIDFKFHRLGKYYLLNNSLIG